MISINEVAILYLQYEKDGVPESSLAAMRIIVSDIYQTTTYQFKGIVEAIREELRT